MFQTSLFIFALLFGLSRITLAESSIEKLQSTAAQSIKEAAGLSQAQMAVSLIQSKFFPDAGGNPPVWRVVSDPNSSDKPRIEATEFNAQGTIVNLASSWGNSDYIVDQSGLAALKQTSSLTNPGLEQDGFIGIPNLSGLSSAEKAGYFGSATSRIPASTNAIQKVPITFKSLSTGTGEFALLNVQVGSMNVEIPVPISGGWYQEAYIKAVNGDANDHFGRSAVISGDVLVVGAVNEDSNERTITNGTTASSNNDLVDSGAIYIYRRSGSAWQQEAYIKAPNNSPIGRGGSINNEFGHIPVQISNNTIVVGADGEDGSQTVITNGTYVGPGSDPWLDVGAAYVFRKIGSTWTNEAYLKAPNGNTTPSFRFGFSVAISGDTIAVGAIGDASSQITITNGPNITSDASKSNSGAVYIFSRTANQWALQAYLKASNADPGDCFGHSMGISGDVLVVGSNYEASNQTTITNGSSASSNNSSPDSGAVYVFRRNGLLWEQEAYLKAPNTGAGDRFGGQYRGVKISGDTIVAGAYLEDSNQTTITNGIPASDNELLSDSGAAYVFRRIGQQWSLEAYLKAPNAGQDDHFGRSLDISGDTIVVGAWYEDSSNTSITNSSVVAENNTASNSGAAYVFKRTGNQWSHEAYLKAANAETGVLGSITEFGGGDKFGLFTSISGDSIAVGAWHEDSNQTTITNGPTASKDNSKPDSGAVYVFRRREVESTPSISSVTPSTAFCPGNSIIIFGSGFMKDATVKVGDQPCVSKTTQGPNEIVCEVPQQPNSIPGTPLSVTVENPNGNTATLDDVFTCDGWYQEAYIKAPNAGAGDNLGQNISISEDTLVVGARFEDSNQTTITNGNGVSNNNLAENSGAAYVFKRVGSSWALEAYLKASNAEASDDFGHSVDISADTLVVGAFGEDSNQTLITNETTSSVDNSIAHAGAAYVFRRQGSSWVQEAYLKPFNPHVGGSFGVWTTISGDTIAVGSLDWNSAITITNGTTPTSSNTNSKESGAVYVFKRIAGRWEPEAYLKAPNNGSEDWFGYKTELSGDVLVVGAFKEDNSQTTITNGSLISDNNSSVDAGAAYVFRRSSRVWALEAYLKAPNNQAGSWFGHGVSISNDTIVVGAERENNNQTVIAASTATTNVIGAAYVFRWTGDIWNFEAYLKAPNAGIDDQFGRGVSVSGDRIAISAFREDNALGGVINGTFNQADSATANNSGAVYVFRRQNNKWVNEAYLKAANPGAQDVMGASTVALSGDTLVVPAPYEDSSQTTITNGQTASADNSATDSGAVYVFRRPEKSATPDITSVTPTQAFCPGGNIVIFGSGFMKDAVASVDGVDCSSTTVQGPNETICTTPQVTSTEGAALTIRVTNPNGKMDTFLDTSNWVRTTSVNATNSDWIPAGITVTKGRSLQITASGTVSDGVYSNVRPTGVPQSAMSHPCRVSGTSFNGSALLGKIGKNGTPFLIGSTVSTAAAASSGELYLIHNDPNCAADNSGSFSVTITAPKAFNCELPVTQCYVSARGGTLLPDLVLGTEKYRIHEFKTVGPTNFTIDSSCPSAVEVLIVAGGGGGGRGFKASGGGGGGGVINNKTQDLPAGSYTITVGSGGAAGAKGNNSVIAGNGVSLVAIGGGRGGDGENCCTNRAGGDGGSGGGGGQRTPAGPGGSQTPGQGFRGGDARGGNWIAGGGGGGAGGAGQNGWGEGDTVGGNGGAGKQVDIYGERNPNGSIKYTYFAGGGGGQSESYGSAGKWPGVGGTGGGGLGGKANVYGASGGANTGGGGGGGSGPGGSGIVVIRYRIAP
jgi:hypothetical protein